MHAFKTDTHTLLKSQFHGADHHGEGMRDAMKGWIAHPKVDVLVAKEAQTGRLVGSIAWGRRGFEGDVDLPMDTAAEIQPREGPKKIGELEEFSNAGMMSWALKLMPEGSRCRYIIFLTVDPAYQGRGVGKQLMQWGTDKADSEGTYCWVSSSMGGVGAFEKHGFRQVGKIEANLDEYSEGESGQPRTVPAMDFGVTTFGIF